MLSVSPDRGCQHPTVAYNVRFMFSDDDDFVRFEAQADALVQNHRRLLRRLVAMRKHHHLTQADVAERMGVSQPAVAAFERYDANPTLSTIRRYALAVDARIEERVIDDCKPDTGWSLSETEASPLTAVVPQRTAAKQPWAILPPRAAVKQ